MLANVQSLGKLTKDLLPAGMSSGGHMKAMLDTSINNDLQIALAIENVLTIASADSSTRVSNVLQDLHEAGLVLPIHENLVDFDDFLGTGDTPSTLLRMSSQVLNCQLLIDHLQEIREDFDTKTADLDKASFNYLSQLTSTREGFRHYVQNLITDLDEAQNKRKKGRSAPPRTTEAKKETTNAGVNNTADIKLAKSLGLTLPAFDPKCVGESIYEFTQFLSQLKDKDAQGTLLVTAFFKSHEKMRTSIQTAPQNCSVDDLLAHCFTENITYLSLRDAQKYSESVANFLHSDANDHELLPVIEQFHARVRGWKHLLLVYQRALKIGLKVQTQVIDDHWISDFVMEHLTPQHRIDANISKKSQLTPWQFLEHVLDTVKASTVAQGNRAKRSLESHETFEGAALQQPKKPKKANLVTYSNPNCRDFRVGRCSRGNSCRFSHIPQKFDNACRQWGNKGACSFGNRCRYSHAPTDGHDGNFTGANVMPLNMANEPSNPVDMGRGRMPQANPYLPVGDAAFTLPTPAGRGNGVARGGFHSSSRGTFRGGKGNRG